MNEAVFNLETAQHFSLQLSPGRGVANTVVRVCVVRALEALAGVRHPRRRVLLGQRSLTDRQWLRNAL